MATATVTGLTVINEVENSTGLVSIGGGPGAAITDDVFIQGTAAAGRRGATGGRGFGYNVTSIDFTVSGRLLWIWINIPLGPAGLNTRANGGLRIRVGSSTGGTANFKDFYVGGGDVTTPGWKRYVLDVTKTASASSGTPNMADVQFIGIFTDWLSVPGGNVPHYVIDAFHYGSTLTVTGGSSEDRLTWRDIAAYTEDSSRMWGVLQGRGGVFFANGDIRLGDGAGTGSCWLQDADQIIEFEEQAYYDGSSVVTAVTDTLQGISVAGNATGTTDIQDGIKIGTGDDMAGSNGSLIQMEPGATTRLHVSLSGANVSNLALYSTAIKRATQEVSFSSDPTDGPEQASTYAANVNTFQAKLWLFDDNVGGADRYVAIWYQNGQPVTVGVTEPKIEVFAADGAVLVTEDAMTEIGTTGTFRYVETTNRIQDGTAYIARITAVIAGSIRTWFQPVGRDSFSGA